MPKMELTNCPLCKSNEFNLHTALEDYYTRQSGLFTFVRCLQCGLIYLNPRPTVETIGDYYPLTYESHIPFLVEDLPLPKRWLVQYGLWKRCRPLLVDEPQGKVLDVGCGSGHFLAAMKHNGWEAVGIDRNPQAVTFAKEVLNVKAYVGRIEENDFADQEFDAVTMWDTLEHFHYPREVLLETQRVLKPEGALLLRVPLFDSIDAHLFGSYWAGLDAPRHLTVFSGKTLTRLLRETGFVIKRLWCMSGSHSSFAISLRFLLGSRKRNGRLGYLLQRIVASLPGSVLSAPYFFAIDKLLLGPEITVLARKRE